MSVFRIPEGDNLVTYYMLPLVGVNKLSFGRHFKTSYIDKYGHKVYVELKSNMQNPLYKGNPNYVTEVVIQNTKFVQFVLPVKCLEDSKKFIAGKYSTMSVESKKIIYNTSTLPYNATMGAFSVSHPVLQALDKTKTLRTYLKSIIGDVVDDLEELMEAPEEDWFIENRIK